MIDYEETLFWLRENQAKETWEGAKKNKATWKRHAHPTVTDYSTTANALLARLSLSKRRDRLRVVSKNSKAVERYTR